MMNGEREVRAEGESAGGWSQVAAITVARGTRPVGHIPCGRSQSTKQRGNSHTTLMVRENRPDGHRKVCLFGKSCPKP